jgi:CPA2 family monovalent cation:H+ antiporter-2
VSAGIVPRSLYPVAVGLSLITAVIGPILTRQSDRLAPAIERILPRFVIGWIDVYHDRLSQRLARPTGGQIARELVPAILYLLFMSALLVAVEPIHARAERMLGEDWLFPGALKSITGLLLAALLLAPLIATWRRLSQLSVVLAGAVNPFVTVMFKIVVAVVLAAWLIPLLPFEISLAGSLIVLLMSTIAIAVIAWPHLNRWHARVEEELANQLHAAQSPSGAAGLARSLKERPFEWGIRLEEVALSEGTPHAGRSIADLAIRQQFGCSIVGIERRGFAILNPSRDEVLYSGDRLLLLGTPEQVDQAETFLQRAAAQSDPGGGFDELTIESHVVPEGSPAVGRSLIDLDLIRRFGVQVGGIERAGIRRPTPTGSTVIEAQDQLLLIGTPRAIRELVEWIDGLGRTIQE